MHVSPEVGRGGTEGGVMRLHVLIGSMLNVLVYDLDYVSEDMDVGFASCTRLVSGMFSGVEGDGASAIVFSWC